MKKILEAKRICANGKVGDEISLTLKVSKGLWDISTDLMSDEQLEEIGNVVASALNDIELIFRIQFMTNKPKAPAEITPEEMVNTVINADLNLHKERAICECMELIKLTINRFNQLRQALIDANVLDE